MHDAAVDYYGKMLLRAFLDRTPIAPLTDTVPGLTIEEAYRIQTAFASLRKAEEGSRVVGHKIGLTSQAVQDALNVRQPDFGQLLSSMALADGAAVSTNSLIAPRAEGELAFVLKAALAGPGIGPADVVLATDFVVPCFEIVDSRIKDWKIRIQDTIADNASAGLYVLGNASCHPREVDLALLRMVIEKNGEPVGSGSGSAVLGSPLNAVAWLANTLGTMGIALRAGDTILSGAFSGLIPIEAGDRLKVTMSGIGTAEVSFTEGHES